MNEVIKILMKRDNISREEAKDQINIFLEDAEDYIQDGDLFGLEELLIDELGLDPDYLFDIFGVFGF